MKKITSEEFIIGLLLSKQKTNIEITTLYSFDCASREKKMYCGFTFYDLKYFTHLYPSIFEYKRNSLTIKRSNDKIIGALKTIYGINEDMNEILDIWKKI